MRMLLWLRFLVYHQEVIIKSLKRSSVPTKQRVRVIAGRWRGRWLPVVDADGLRPTGDRVRETLFNWLQGELPGARWLDLFAGSGALGFEALSREAHEVVMLEQNPVVVRQLKSSQQLLGAEGARIVMQDSFRWLSAPITGGMPFDGVFCDPPFADERVETLVDALIKGQWLRPHGWLYLEQPKGRVVSLPQFECYRQQSTGQVTFGLWRYLPHQEMI